MTGNEELDIWELAKRGYSNAQISKIKNIEVNYVENYLKSRYLKNGIINRLQAFILEMRR